MRFRRRRQRRLTWFPPIGTERNASEALDQAPSGRFFTINVQSSAAGVGGHSTIQTPLTFDQSAEQEALALATVNPTLLNAMSLADFEQQSWRLRRVVGKLFAGCANDDQQAQGPPAVLFSAGLMVRTVDEENGVPLSPLPEQHVDSIGSNRDPWIWRREWILASSFPGGGTSGVTDALLSFPRTTADYGSIQDGSHIDQKTNRIIGPNERLILTLTGTALPLPNPDNTNQAVITGYFDYRLLGSVMKASNRRNASR